MDCIALLPPLAKLQALFELDRITGTLTWRERSAALIADDRIRAGWNTKYAGKVAGSFNSSNGYWMVSIDRRMYMAHRIVYVLANEVDIGQTEVDHRDGIILHNAPLNLRLATRVEQMVNRKLHTNNTSGVKGVSFCNTYRQWTANIQRNNVRVSLGYFDDMESAVAARLQAEKVIHNEFTRALA